MKNPLLFIMLLFLGSFISSAQIPVSEIQALKAFYDATGGPGWFSESDGDPTNDWNFVVPIENTVVTNDWYGLTISGNNITQISMNPTSRDVDRNNLTGTLPPEIENLPFLQVLNLFSEDLSGTIPESITSLSNLATLNLGRNNFSGEIPVDIGNLTSLINLVLRENELTGTIPPSIGNLSNLESLLIDGNLLTGAIPPEVGNLSSLEYLWLSANNLSGTIPVALEKLVNLIQLNLSSNQLSGNIPVELGNLPNLQSLSLSYNELTGTIPVELGQLSNLRSLSLRVNELSGGIPIELTLLNNLSLLFLQDNNLSGEIPVELEDLINLEQLSLSKNNFTGEIPDELGNLTKLKTLSLSDNQLTGEIPDTFSNLLDLHSFQVENNQLSGPLPSGLVNWVELELLYIYNNNFEGVLPDFSNANDLDFLRFGDNRFEFGDFEDQFNDFNSNLIIFEDTPQAKVDEVENITTCTGNTVTLETTVSGSANTYEWFKDGVAIPGSDSVNLELDNLQISDSGVYTCIITSAIVTDLVLERNPITLTVSDVGSTANPIENLYACDTDGDGIETFALDLAQIESQVIGPQTGVTVSYFDAMGNPLNLTASYTNTTPGQQDITVRVTSSSGCYNETVFSLLVQEAPVADIFGDVERCDNFELPALSANNYYYTGPNKTGTQLYPGDVISETTTLYIYAENGSGSDTCTDESNFTVTINGVNDVTLLEDVTECKGYILPILPTDESYFTESNGEGLQLYPGDEIVETQLIYVRSESNGCARETNFTVTIDTVACNDSESLELPKFFTPNNDGTNDYWDTSILAGGNRTYIYVFDRYGKLLVQLDPNNNASWDGTYNGRPMPSDDYWFTYVDQETGKTLSGHFTLKR
ncbi:hypothetical protein B4Q04_10020 [Zobellia sp. OII3]|uniref:T9SS type B sorting domain-containing protein n=1 Tax=Zobellia sp. OII3 TaxID=2034520 RepID=UPI000B52E63C|nr:T9SS type B sorting domain-containing protein [Zobellia sp. OII3]OWW25915.1 hypothetical protein B4Q04_10020 [Zobellia sp. OII3]